MILVTIFILLLISIMMGFGFAYGATKPNCKCYDYSYKKIKEQTPHIIKMYECLKKEIVSIASPFGYKLHGIFFPNKKIDKILILSHGVTANLWYMLKYGFLYFERGYSLLAYDHRNHGKSGGINTSYGYYEKEDLRACISWVREKYGNNVKIGLNGESMGSAIVLEYLGKYDDVDFSVCICGYDDFKEEAKFLLKNEFNIKLKLLQNYIIFFSNIAMKLRNGWFLKDVSPINSVKKTRTPLFFIHGTDDDVVPFDMCDKIFSAKEYGFKDKYIVDKASHTTTLDLNKNVFKSKLFKFLDRVEL